MTAVHIVLLRAVNVGGQTIRMADLRAFAEELGYAEPQTLLQSGNLILRGGEGGAALEAKLEREAQARLGLKTAFIVRSPQELDAVIAGNPLPEPAQREPNRLLVTFLKSKPDAETAAAMEAAPRDGEVVRVIGREAYVHYPDGAGRSRLRLKPVGTARNWNTVLKLQALARA